MERHLPVSSKLRSIKLRRRMLTDLKGVFFFFGCMLMILGAVGEWIVGNTFPFVVFGTFGEHIYQIEYLRNQGWR